MLVLVVALVLVFTHGRHHAASLAGQKGASGPPVPKGHLVSAKPLTQGIPSGVRGWRIIYGTTDSQGKSVRASGVVLVPTKAHHGPRPVLSVGHGTTGIQTSCAPSLSSDFPVDPASVPLTMLKRGWAVVQSDYIGQGIPGPHGVHPYLDGTAEAHAVLDATRAARQLTAADAGAKTVLYGLSQGGHAVLFAGAQAASYAPDLHVLGVAAGAPATDLALILAADGHSLTGLMLSSYIADAWNATYPSAHLEDAVTHWAAAKQIAGQCADKALTAARSKLADVPMFDGQSVTPGAKKVFAKNTPTAHIDAPLFVGQGTKDTIVPLVAQEAWAKQRCNAGQQMEFRTYPGLTHTTLAAPNTPFDRDVVAWISARLAGKAPTPTC